jgi:invasion protein IalB
MKFRPLSRSFLTLAILFLGLVVVGSAALAQQQQQQQRSPVPPAPAPKKPEAGKLYDDWGIECEAAPDKTEKCFISQSQHQNPGGQRIVYFRVGHLGPKNEVVAIVSLPLGIDLQSGVMLKFEPGPQVPLTMQMCEPGGCRGVATLDAAAQKALREAKAINIVMLPFGGDKALQINISVKGLPAAFAALR